MINGFDQKNIIKQIYRRKQLIKFSSVGFICLIVNLTIIWILTEKLNLEDITATIISFFIANLLGFFLNKYFTFKVKNNNIFKEIYKYYTVISFSFIINIIFISVLVKLFQIWVIYATIIVSLFVYIYNYIMHKNWSFKQSQKSQKLKG